MKKRTKEEIEQQIAKLKELRPRVRPCSAFGDDNLAKLDAQVKVLEENMDSDDIFNEWPQEEGDMMIRMAADEACNWLVGESEYEDLADEEEWPLL